MLRIRIEPDVVVDIPIPQASYDSIHNRLGKRKPPE
jgi:hypothetical protein